MVLSFLVPLQAVATVSSWSLIGDVALLLALPVFAVTIVNIADSVLLGAAVADGFRYGPWVFTAEAKGLEDREIFNHHVRGTMLLPLLSRLVANIPLVLGSLVIVEYGFQTIGQDYFVAAYGLSSALFSALQNGDIPIVLGAFFVLGVIAIVARLALDIAQLVLDPRSTATSV